MQGPGLLGTSDTSSTASIKVMSVLTPLRLAGTTLDIAPSGVDTTELADDSVTEAKIADGAITSDKIAADNQYHSRYDTEAETARSGATTTTEIYYTARPDGDGYAESEVTTSTPAGAVIRRRLYFSDKFDADPDTSGDWTLYTTQPADDTAFATAKASLLAGLSDTDATANTRGTLPVSLKMEHEFATDLLLEDYPGAEGAYSVRKIRYAYTGDAMRIREDSGNTETDIGFDSNGDLDTAAIASHCGSANGYVVTWYDQSGNGNDATQSTTTKQPQIYNGSAVLTDNGKPALKYVTTNSLRLPNAMLPSAINNCSSFTVQSPTSGISLQLGDETSPANRWFLAFGYIGSDYFGYAGTFNAINLGSTTSTQKLLTAIAGSTQGNAQAFANGTSKGSLALSSAVPTSGKGYIGRDTNFVFNGNMQEVIVYHSDESSNRTGIESNINTYFSIYP